MQSLSVRRAIAVAARLVGVSGIIVAAAWALTVLLWTERALLACSVRAIDTVEWIPISRTIEVEQEGGFPKYRYVRIVGDTVWRMNGPYHYHGHNLFLLLGLALASPGLRWRQRLLGAGVFLTLLFFVDVLIVMGDIWELDEGDLPSLPENFRSRLLPGLGAFARTLHPTGGLFMLPVLLWGLFLLGSGSTRAKRRRPGERPGGTTFSCAFLPWRSASAKGEGASSGRSGSRG